MANIKYLKLLKNHSVTLYSGRPDFLTIKFCPDEYHNVQLYYDIVEPDKNSVNYNESVIQSYIDNNILCTFSIAEPELPAPVIPPPSYTNVTYRLRQFYHFVSPPA